MLTYDWKPFLIQWSKELIASENIGIGYWGLAQEMITSGWVGYPAASDEQIAAAEARLGKTLPASYREFLKVTNGWGLTGTCCVRKWWSIEEIGWYAERHTYEIEAWTDDERRSGWFMPDKDYFVYGEEQGIRIRAEYLKTALEISDVDEGSVYLLNPQVVNDDGEWETWFFADWFPGAERYRSFWELMRGEHRKFQRQEAHESKRYKSDDILSLPDKIPGLIEELVNEIVQ